MTNATRVLLVDDAAGFRRSLRAALEACGIECVEASEGVEALWRARTDPRFQLLVVDVHMPAMDGLSFIRQVRSLPDYESVPIVVVTSDKSLERLQEGRLLGVTAWVLKPPDLPALVNSIRITLRKSATRTSAPPRSAP